MMWKISGGFVIRVTALSVLYVNLVLYHAFPCLKGVL